MTLTELAPENSTRDLGSYNRLNRPPAPRQPAVQPALGDQQSARPASLKQFVRTMTFREVLPVVAIGLGVVVLAVGAVLVWQSIAASSTTGAVVVDTDDQVVDGADSISENRLDLLVADGASDEIVIVHVAGQVTSPGIVEIRANGRVIEAVEAAGGPLPDADLDRINLAAFAIDGSQILVPAIATETVPLDPSTDPRTNAAAASPSEASPSDALTPPQQPGQAPSNDPALDANAPDTTTNTSTDPTTAAPATPQQPGQAPSTDPALNTNAPDTTTNTSTDPGQSSVDDNALADVEDRLFDRDSAPSPEEVQALLAEQGLGMPPELAAILDGLDSPPSDAEFEALLDQFGLGG